MDVIHSVGIVLLVACWGMALGIGIMGHALWRDGLRVEDPKPESAVPPTLADEVAYQH